MGINGVDKQEVFDEYFDSKVIDSKGCKQCVASYNETIGNLTKMLGNQKEEIEKMFKCLIQANYLGKISDTLWLDEFTTLFDNFAILLQIKDLDKYVADCIKELETFNVYEGH